MGESAGEAPGQLWKAQYLQPALSRPRGCEPKHLEGEGAFDNGCLSQRWAVYHVSPSLIVRPNLADPHRPNKYIGEQESPFSNALCVILPFSFYAQTSRQKAHSANLRAGSYSL